MRRRLAGGRTRTPALALLYLVGAAAPRFAAFLLLPVYAFELSPAELAAYGIAVSLAQLLGILADAGVLDGLGITYFEQDDEDKAGYLKTVVLVSRLTSVVVMIPLGVLLAIFWEPLFGEGLTLWPGLALVLVFAFLQRGNTLAGGIHRVRNHHGRFASTKLVPALVQTIAGLTYVFVLHLGAAGAVAAAPTGFLVSIVVASIGRRRHTPFARLTTDTAKRIMALGLPVVPESLAKWAQLLSLRPFLQLLSTVQETARFTFASAFAQVVSPITEAYEQYVTPKYYRGCVTGDDGIVTQVRQLTSLFGCVAAGGAVVGLVVLDPLFRGLAPAPYADTAGIAAIGLAGILLRNPMSLMVHNVRTLDRRGALVLTVVVGLVASYVQFLVLVGSLGALAAALSIYVYPAASCLFMLLVLREGRLRIVEPRDLFLTHGAVLVVLLVMLAVTRGAEQSVTGWVVLVVTALLALGVVGAVAHRHLGLVRSLLSGGSPSQAVS